MEPIARGCVCLIERTVERHFTGIEADAGPGLAQAGARSSSLAMK